MDYCYDFCRGIDVPIDCDRHSDCEKYRCLEACRDCLSPNETACNCPYINFSGRLESLVFNSNLNKYDAEEHEKRLIYLFIFICLLLISVGMVLYCLRQWHIRNVLEESRDSGRRRVFSISASKESGPAPYGIHQKSQSKDLKSPEKQIEDLNENVNYMNHNDNIILKQVVADV